jgi:molecular chaperone GrpE
MNSEQTDARAGADTAESPGDPAAAQGASAEGPAGVSAETPSDATTGEGSAEATLAADLDAAQQQAQEYLAMAQRAQADFQNYRRRAEQERTDAYDRGRGETVLQILPVLDDFERALAALPLERREEDWLQGLLLIERKLRSTLEGLGVERIAAEGQPFDPREHEAVMHEPREDIEPDTVATVARQGYRLGSRILRPAQVVVARRP